MCVMEILIFFHKCQDDLPAVLDAGDWSEFRSLHGGVVRECRLATQACEQPLFSADALKASLERRGLSQQVCAFSSPLTSHNHVCVLSVEGMTCGSCVKLIESTIAQESGIASIKVSLQFKKAFIEYDPSLVKPNELAGKIYDMGFDAEVLTMHAPPTSSPTPQADSVLSPMKTSVDATLSTILVNVEGMTCTSCVNNIQSNISKKKGVASVQVSLQEKTAEICYGGSSTSPQKLVDAIEDLGFQATLKSSTPSPFHSSSSSSHAIIESDWSMGSLKMCYVGIDGMTCHSCVSLIESEVGELEGVVSITVSLDCKEGTVEFNDAITSPKAICAAIESMGFLVSYITGRSCDYNVERERERESTTLPNVFMACL